MPGGTAALVRFSATGVADASFAPSPALYVPIFSPMPLLVVQPDGRVLVGHAPAPVANALPAGHSPVARLLSDGSFDPAWSVPGLPADDLLPRATAVQLLATGQVLVAGTLARLGAVGDQERGVAVLDPTGQPTNLFRPVLQQNGYVRDIAQQPDGRLVAVGSFGEVNDAAARGIVRLELNGTVDTAFCRRAQLWGGYGARVVAQPDGTLLGAGTFTAVGGVQRVAVVRLLPSGAPDPTFASPLASSSNVAELVRQPDGRLLVAGALRLPGSSATVAVARLESGGTIDASFLPPAGLTPLVLLPLPNGTIVAGSASAGRQVLRLLSNGTADPSFVAPVLTAAGAGTAAVNAIVQQPDGRLLIGGTFSQVGGVSTTHVARLLANGQPDNTFSSQRLQPTGRVSAVAVQPNGRVLVAGSPALLSPAATPSLYRLLPDGSSDSSFDSNRGPNLGRNLTGIARILVSTSGAIVAAGGFSAVSGLPVLGLTRLLDPNVLALYPGHTVSSVEVWPVPAHDQLHLVLGQPRPRRVSLLSTLGQVLFTQEFPASELTIETTPFKPGLYIIRVDYEDIMPTTRSVILE